ncbi:unnamed protein product, partial [Ectocarpus sp. 13 AM-2016]
RKHFSTWAQRPERFPISISHPHQNERPKLPGNIATGRLHDIAQGSRDIQPPPHTHHSANHLKPQRSQRSSQTPFYSSRRALSLVPDKKERCFGQASSNLTVSSPRSGNSSFVHVADATWSSHEAQR